MPTAHKTQTGINPHQDAFPINIHPDIAEKITSLSPKRKLEAENLVNKILNQYLSEQFPKKESGTKFLLSVAGMFDSGESNTSEKVNSIVSDFILQKHKRASKNESTD